jgi:ubiquinone biosynthesis protein COQ9
VIANRAALVKALLCPVAPCYALSFPFCTDKRASCGKLALSKRLFPCHIALMDAENPYAETRQAVLAAALPHVAFDGWSKDLLARAIDEAAIDNAGIEPNMATLAFPNGVRDLVAAFSEQGDSAMLTALPAPDEMKIRDRIRTAVMARIEADIAHKEAARRAAGFLAVPGRGALAAKLLFHTSHLIWRWAGDTATDYNYYSKRLILGGVLTTTRLTWFGDDSDDLAVTRAFLDRRIDNVMQFEKAKAKIRDCANSGLSGMAGWRKTAQKAAETASAAMRPENGQSDSN